MGIKNEKEKERIVNGLRKKLVGLSGDYDVLIEEIKKECEPLGCELNLYDYDFERILFKGYKEVERSQWNMFSLCIVDIVADDEEEAFILNIS